MALLVYSNGMDVRVATIESDQLFEACALGSLRAVDWEYCGDDNNYRKRCQELQRDNDHLQQMANDMVAQKLILENEVHKLREDNLAMHTKISKAYQVLE